MIVVSDASPLISLAKIGQFHLLKELFSKVVISEDVYSEIVVKGKRLPGSKEVAKAKWITKKKIKNKLKARRLQRIHNLGAGEAATVVLAQEIKAGLAIIDERRARIVALSEGINIIGTLGVLELSFTKNLITDLPRVYQQLRDKNVRIDDKLLSDSLKRFGFKKP